MSVKLKRSKFLISFLLIFFSCGKQKVFYNTEILCPDGSQILVRYAGLEEMKAAIIKADADKKFYKTNESYTVIRLPGNRSFKIEKIPPELMVQCSLRQSVVGQADKNYVKYFDAEYN